ncbi:MAG: hypothetical protein M3355_11940 [Actinomycetota bacterium]|nr:hypothetical protein [Actinomycetota bacterium]
MSEADLSQAEEILRQTWGMAPSAAARLREKLMEERRQLDGQILILDQIIDRRNDAGPPPADQAQPLFPAPAGPPEGKPSRRLAVLQFMDAAPERIWFTKEIKERLVSRGVVSGDAEGAKRVYAALNEAKGRGEVEHLGQSQYRITRKGSHYVARAP